MKRLFIISLISLFMIVACQQNEELVSEENAIVTFNNKELKKVGLTSKRGNTKTISFTIAYRSKSKINESRNCFIKKLNINLLNIKELGIKNGVYREIITIKTFEIASFRSLTEGAGSADPKIVLEDDEGDNGQPPPYTYLRVSESELKTIINDCGIQYILVMKGQLTL